MADAIDKNTITGLDFAIREAQRELATAKVNLDGLFRTRAYLAEKHGITTPAPGEAAPETNGSNGNVTVKVRRLSRRLRKAKASKQRQTRVPARLRKAGKREKSGAMLAREHENREAISSLLKSGPIDVKALIKQSRLSNGTVRKYLKELKPKAELVEGTRKLVYSI